MLDQAHDQWKFRESPGTSKEGVQVLGDEDREIQQVSLIFVESNGNHYSRTDSFFWSSLSNGLQVVVHLAMKHPI